MRKFIIKILFFILITVLIYLSIFKFLKFRIAANIKKSSLVILGDSHTEYTDLPDVFNWSISGSPYFVHYFFCSEFIEQLKGKKVYIVFSYHNFSNLYENRLKNDSLLPNYKTEMLNHIDDFNLFNKQYCEIGYNDDYVLFNAKKIKFLFLHQSGFTRKINRSDNVSNKPSIIPLTNNHYLNPKYVLKDKLQNKYLQKVIELLKKNNCDVSLLLMPLTTDYKKKVPLEIKNRHWEYAMTNHIKILDLDSILAISEKYEYFKDYDHLNRYGDSLVAQWFITSK